MEYEFKRYFGLKNLGVNRSTARRMLTEWVRSFGERHPQGEV